MIIDPHVHVWINAPDYPWPVENTNPPEEDRTAEMLLEVMAAHGVDRAVLVHPIHYLWDNSYAVDCAARYPDRFMAVGRVNPEDADAPDHLSRWTEETCMHGVRISPRGDQSGDWFGDVTLMNPLFARAEALGVPLLIYTQGSRLADLVPLLERHPNLNVVVDHMAQVQGPDEEAQLIDLSRHPCVYVKISHLPSFSSTSYPWRGSHDLVRRLRESYGAPRLMWNSDWPVSLSSADYGQTLSAVRDEMGFISPEDMGWILGGTALKLWNFTGGAH